MAKTTDAANKARSKSTSGVRHGANDKNVVTGGRSTGRPTSNGKTAPIKGSNRGGV